MPYALSPTTFKRQAKIMVNHWPFTPLKTTQARELLSQLYGYKNHHHYQQAQTATSNLLPIKNDTVVSHYRLWVKHLADLGSMNQIQARQLLHRLWPAYLGEQVDLNDKLYQATLRFHDQCLDFIGAANSQNATTIDIPYAFDDRPAVKDAIEALGVPHPEVGAIKVNQQWVGFDYLLMDHDHIEVFANPHNAGDMSLPYKPEGKRVFLLDVHLSRLARYLRMAGFDCLHQNEDVGDALLAEVSAQQDYMLLTRDIGLLKRGKVKYGHWVREVQPEAQFKEIVKHYQLQQEFAEFTRCIKCNGEIIEVDKNTIKDNIPDKVFQTLDEFRQCDACHQVYWKGSHYERIQAFLAQVSDEVKTQ